MTENLGVGEQLFQWYQQGKGLQELKRLSESMVGEVKCVVEDHADIGELMGYAKAGHFMDLANEACSQDLDNECELGAGVNSAEWIAKEYNCDYDDLRADIPKFIDGMYDAEEQINSHLDHTFDISLDLHPQSLDLYIKLNFNTVPLEAGRMFISAAQRVTNYDRFSIGGRSQRHGTLVDPFKIGLQKVSDIDDVIDSRIPDFEEFGFAIHEVDEWCFRIYHADESPITELRLKQFEGETVHLDNLALESPFNPSRPLIYTMRPILDQMGFTVAYNK